MKKPISPKMHGIIDYAFAGVQLLGPSLLGLNKEVRTAYKILGAGFTGVNAFTKTPVGISKKISMKSHQKADALFLATLSGLSTLGIIKNHKKSLAFHMGFLGLALMHYALTDYDGTKR
ncbi:hypothetical protein [Dyadobacter crusticola]|uniref:hypothetical protein n=1 Tax=Dyadobacter crusticola TaxID=292407 RepID=UPI00068F93AD|nr:hypothetical protein [Dyadobacter crusticola]